MKFLVLPFLFLTFVSVQAQWDLQYPFDHLGVINDILINGSVGIAVGDDATIFLTEDEGRTWSMRNNDLIGWNFATAEREKEVIYACGRGIYKSEDGGETFEVLANAPQEIFDSYLSEDGVLIVSNNGGVFKSTDQGETFVSINTPVDSLGITSFILDEDHIWWATAGSEPVMYITEDGGLNWVANTDLVRPKKMAFFDENIGIAQSLPYWYWTEDGGNTWEERARLSRNVGKVVFGENPNTLYLSSSKNFYSSYDGGASFEENKNILGVSLVNGLFVKESGNLLVGASNSSIAESSDMGENWEDITGKVKPSITAMASNDGKEVFAIGFGHILRTTNGGNEWNVFDTLNTAIQDAKMIDDQTLILSGIRQILKKDLISKEETTLYGPVSGIFESIDVLPSGSWLSYNSRDYLLISEDQGASWDSIYLEENTNGLDMMENGDLFLRVRGKLLFSDDEGLSWKEIYKAEVERDLEAISVADSTIYIMESLRNLRKSSDYGVTWDSLATPTGFSMIVREILFTSPDTGYVYDSSEERIWYTYDGGQTWPFSYYPKSRLNGMYQFRNEDLSSIWLHGLGGFIERQSQCINSPLLSEIVGERFPCLLDTVTYSVEGSNIDNFVWNIPDEWELVGSSSESEIRVYAKEPGVGYLTVYGENSCGTSDALELQIAGTAIPQVELVNDGGSLSTEAEGEAFQWFRDGDIIPDANSSFFLPTESGVYTVLVTFSTGCSRLSNNVSIELTDVEELERIIFKIYPNPISEGSFFIKHNHDKELSNIKIFDTLGRTLDGIIVHPSVNRTVVNLPPETQDGLYFIHIAEVKYSRAVFIE